MKNHIRIILVIEILILTFVFSCNIRKGNENLWIPIRNSDKFTVSDTLGYTGKDTFLINYFSDSTIKSKGNYAISNDTLFTGYKTGNYIEYYSNGKPKEEGQYEIGKYKQCCYKGLCMQFYNYKIGVWKYWYENGELMANIQYKTTEKHYATSCKGGTKMRFNEIDLLKSNFYDKSANLMLPNKKLIAKYETVFTFPGEFNYFYMYTIDSLNRNEIKHSLREIYD